MEYYYSSVIIQSSSILTDLGADNWRTRRDWRWWCHGISTRADRMHV